MDLICYGWTTVEFRMICGWWVVSNGWQGRTSRWT